MPTRSPTLTSASQHLHAYSCSEEELFLGAIRSKVFYGDYCVASSAASIGGSMDATVF